MPRRLSSGGTKRHLIIAQDRREDKAVRVATPATCSEPLKTAGPLCRVVLVSVADRFLPVISASPVTLDACYENIEVHQIFSEASHQFFRSL